MGEWTDDTAMMLALGQSLSDRDGYDEDDLFARYAVWIRSGPKDVGATVRGALERAHSRTRRGRWPRRYHDESGDGTARATGRRRVRRRSAPRHRSDRSELEPGDAGADSVDDPPRPAGGRRLRRPQPDDGGAAVGRKLPKPRVRRPPTAARPAIAAGRRARPARTRCSGGPRSRRPPSASRSPPRSGARASRRRRVRGQPRRRRRHQRRGGRGALAAARFGADAIPAPARAAARPRGDLWRRHPSGPCVDGKLSSHARSSRPKPRARARRG